MQKKKQKQKDKNKKKKKKKKKKKDISPKKFKTGTQTDMRTPMLIAVLFAIANWWKQP